MNPSIRGRLIPLLLALFALFASPALHANQPLELLFLYGSEKKAWISDVTRDFNRRGFKLQDGRQVQVSAEPMGSGATMQAVLDGSRQAHLVSPASGVFIELANADWQQQAGRDLVGETRNLVLSPVVIAIWKPMAEALGWGERALGWSDILHLAKSDTGWGEYGHPEWGPFKFGHTHPKHSNSGLLSLIAETYAASGKTRGLKLSDVESPATLEFVRGVESSVVHYGRSTGFFGRKMMANGMEYLSAAVLYENMVLESYGEDLAHPLVAIYPKEGTFWSDHPVGLVERDWVSDAHREAGWRYMDFLMEKAQQEKALQYGFRPADVDIPVADTFTAARGVDADEPKTTLRVPPGRVIRAIMDELWVDVKKHANVVLVMDTSGSMNGTKLERAKDGAVELVRMLGDADQLSTMFFSSNPYWMSRDQLLGPSRAEAEQQIRNLRANGGTAFYDAVLMAKDHLTEHAVPGTIGVVVVLTDGEDTHSRADLDGLLEGIRLGPANSVRIFPIAYGEGASMQVMEPIADATQVKAYKGSTENIEKIFSDISTFF